MVQTERTFVLLFSQRRRALCFPLSLTSRSDAGLLQSGDGSRAFCSRMDQHFAWRML